MNPAPAAGPPWPTTREAEHEAARGWQAAPEWAFTSVLPDGAGYVVGTDPGSMPAGSRAFRYPGQAELEAAGSVTVEWVLAHTAITMVRALGGGEATPDRRIDPQGFVRPVMEAAGLTLWLRPASGDRWVPFEQRDPTPCCAGH